MRRIRVMVVVVLVAMFGPAMLRLAGAQNTSDRLDTRTYDVSDLLRTNANYPLDDSPAPSPEATPPVQIDAVVELIQDTVATDTWRDKGGTIGSIRPFNSMLIITTSTTAHNAIVALLEQMRSDPGPTTMLTVRTYWLKLDPQEVAAIFAARNRAADAVVSEMPVVPDNLLDRAHLYFMGQTTCFNRQTVSIVSGRSSPYVADLTPVVASGVAAFDPTMRIAGDGVRLQVTPRMMPDGTAVVVDLHNTMLESHPAGQIPLRTTTQPAAIGVDVDRMNTTEQKFNTTVRIPLSKRILIGGMTLEPAEGENPGRQLFLAVEVDAVR